MLMIASAMSIEHPMEGIITNDTSTMQARAIRTLVIRVGVMMENCSAKAKNH